MLICLPLEGMAAVAMSNCQMHDPHQMTVAADNAMNKVDFFISFPVQIN